MDQQLNFVTIAAVDLDTTRRFYGALGWHALLDVEGEIVFYQTAPGQVLAFFLAEKFNADLGLPADHPAAAVSGITLAHNVGSDSAVIDIVAAMAEAGGTILKAPQPGQFGGVFHAHVRDPNGVIWEIAHNPGWRVDPDGTVRIG
ncbi:putative glyoxalase/bleomycin resistance protein [Mycolicibacterium canariasense]|uniref:Putative glyoxalase/bleomycin resistance protein n=1 Tax=Mycolicibacterium canariasense TaxID=228230 RepID=A0A100WBK4_MYCCR|nr:VOC family protein [Mycolicibacterium canariasense]MCV7209453.1 VOC family protein [Mycolicibacterium canariasense]ORV05745.1 glyoxalase [Mycolicibacterium canariasense]GAS95011.1 putative glyoxalase/bleomycin resistance protein [Mycolicibacterium canariasense]